MIKPLLFSFGVATLLTYGSVMAQQASPPQGQGVQFPQSGAQQNTPQPGVGLTAEGVQPNTGQEESQCTPLEHKMVLGNVPMKELPACSSVQSGTLPPGMQGNQGQQPQPAIRR
jgi:hypothetical protein